MLTNPTGNGPDDGSKGESSRDQWLRLARVSAYLTGAGFQMAAIVTVFTLGANWIDKRVEAGGLITIAGGVAGFGISLWAVLRTFKRMQGYLEKDETK